ncbi:MAG: flagellar cap protein FliD N-terminal domain-containing protein, partial [Pseudomonadales bacterium]
MPTITSIGTGSGIDLEGLVGQILEAERAPAEQRLDLREAETEASISAYGNLKSTLSAFQATLADLSDADNVETRSAASSNEEIFTASANNDAQPTTNSIQ